MNKENNKTEIIESLKDLISVCKRLNCQFQIFGSLIPAALKGEFHRELGDIDCFIDGNFKEVVARELEKMGYKKSFQKDEDISSPLFFIGFRTENFLKDKKKISLFYVSFRKDYMEIPLRFGLSFRVPYDLLNREYKFYGEEFMGLIPEAALFNVALVGDSIKREIDFDVLFPLCNLENVQKMKKRNTFFWLNKRVPLISKLLASRINKLLPQKK